MGFSKNGGVPNNDIMDVMETSIKIWMITGGSPIFGNHPNVVNHLSLSHFARHGPWAWAMAPNKNLPGDPRNLWPRPVGPGAV